MTNPSDEAFPFRLSPEQKQKLLESMAEADRGEFVDVDELMAELDHSKSRSSGMGVVRVIA